MRFQAFLSIAASLSAAGLVAACHSHGFQAVSAVDHQVTVAFFRHATQYQTADVKIANGSPQAICLGPASFDPSSFSVKTEKGMAQNTAPAAPAATACDLLAPGAVKAQPVNAGMGFSRYDLQAGRLCYRYAFAAAPSGPAWQASGTVCE